MVKRSGQQIKDIEEKIPLKQGLKPQMQMSYRARWIIEEKIPLKQGLKHM